LLGGHRRGGRRMVVLFELLKAVAVLVSLGFALGQLAATA
jgi:hypothetical protein